MARSESENPVLLVLGTTPLIAATARTNNHRRYPSRAVDGIKTIAVRSRRAAWVCAGLALCALATASAQENQQHPATPPPAQNNSGPGPAVMHPTARRQAASDASTKAVALCSGLWEGGRTVEQINADNDGFAGTESMKTEIDYDRKIVTVKYSDVMPPRIVACRPVLGCVQLPIGASEDALKYVPQVDPSVVRPDLDAKDWPTGDQNATARAARSKAKGARRRCGRGLRRQDLQRTHLGHHRGQRRQDRGRALRHGLRHASGRANAFGCQELYVFRGRHCYLEIRPQYRPPRRAGGMAQARRPSRRRSRRGTCSTCRAVYMAKAAAARKRISTPAAPPWQNAPRPTCSIRCRARVSSITRPTRCCSCRPCAKRSTTTRLFGRCLFSSSSGKSA